MSITGILLIDCPDRKGIVAAVAEFLYRHNANILHADQHQDAERGLFLMRVEWDLAGFDLGLDECARQFAPIAERFQMRWRVERSDPAAPRRPVRVEVRPLPGRFALPASERRARLRHPAHRQQPPRRPALGRLLRRAVLPRPGRAGPQGRGGRHGSWLCWRSTRIDLVVLARYMQVLSADFVARFPQRIINVHHSFLPAFSGARPYHRAFERGVKLIGATSHYATQDLDEGPIIEQDVVRVSHRDGLEDLHSEGPRPGEGGACRGRCAGTSTIACWFTRRRLSSLKVRSSLTCSWSSTCTEMTARLSALGSATASFISLPIFATLSATSSNRE